MVPRSTGQERSTQLLRGVLDLCLMSVIDEEASYGYEMVRKLRERGLDRGYAVIENGKIIDLFVRDRREFEKFKANRDIGEIIEELNEEWLHHEI